MKGFIKTLPLDPESDPIIMGKIDDVTLAAPQSFWLAPDDIKNEIVNGCGPGGLGDVLIPDTAYFMSLKPACKIHDWMYAVYNDEKGFKLSNQVFLDNMERINRAKTKNRFLKRLRTRRIRKYFVVVRDFGRLFFYDAHLGFYDNQELYVYPSK